MNVIILAASYKDDGYCLRVMKELKETLEGHQKIPHVHGIEFSEVSVIPSKTARHSIRPRVLSETRAGLMQADAFVIITRETEGKVQSEAVDFLLDCHNGELAHKPAMLVAVSEGNGGHDALDFMRKYTYKTTKICYLPEQIIINDNNPLFFPGVCSESKELIINNEVVESCEVFAGYCEAFFNCRSRDKSVKTPCDYSLDTIQ